MICNALAPIRYSNVFSKYGGPICELHSKPRQIGSDQFGYEAYAQIRPELMPPQENQIYGNYTGTGSDKNRYVAQYKAISEALERWAFHKSIDSSEYGFDLDPSTSGMAAFPGFLSKSARNLGMLEAIERWSIVNWWNGELGARNLNLITCSKDYQILELITPWRNASTVILSSRCPSNSRTAYGFATANNRAAAIKKAEIELYRNLFLLDESACLSPNPTNKNERRLLYFSEGDGYSKFREVALQSTRISKQPNVPKIIVDTEIVGSWTRYCTVWRVLFENKFTDQFSNRLDQFLF